ncbi:putative small auxin-up RNA [Helianthus annuus]|nr:putative small auxin-up RNA [Helianthus annuus]KAJ0470089.1 putative small auxin-up RNA [Helianthus annuus]KAJ0661032.1 putative small auxin-up RNA [Helianthus annuus]KAJ0841569.1 putative small auxin-up RNA [Helianthus annuus]KAJ0855117.1 putative small auxin-up RNA [Helianthus annuus]
MRIGKIVKAWVKRCRKMNNGECNKCWQWASSFMHQGNKEACNIPSDVPKGHLVVYVGENQRRFVIKVKLLKHPLFGALLDEARDECEFSADSRFCIPCDEDIFLVVVQRAMTQRDPRIMLCF